MRKALIGMILAATMLSPVAAQAQRWRGGDRVREQNESSTVSEQRQERSERRQQREAQQAPQVRPVQEAPQVQQAPVVQQRERTGDRGGNRNWRGGNDGTAATGTATTRDRSGDGNRRNWRGNNNQTSVYPQAWQGNPNDPALRRY